MKKLLLVAAFAVLLLFPVLKVKKQENADHSVATGSSMEDVRVVRRDDGKTIWSLRSVRTSISNGANTAGLEGVTVEFPSRGMTVSADSGLFDMENSDFTLEGNIKARTEDFTIRTGSVRLASNKGEIVSDDTVVITGNGFRIQGKGLRAFNEKVQLLEDVRAEFF